MQNGFFGLIFQDAAITANDYPRVAVTLQSSNPFDVSGIWIESIIIVVVNDLMLDLQNTYHSGESRRHTPIEEEINHAARRPSNLAAARTWLEWTSNQSATTSASLPLA